MTSLSRRGRDMGVKYNEYVNVPKYDMFWDFGAEIVVKHVKTKFVFQEIINRTCL